MADNKVKSAPDIAGYYWTKLDGAWTMVEVFFSGTHNRNLIKTFDGKSYFVGYSKEYIGPLTPEDITIYKTVPA